MEPSRDMETKTATFEILKDKVFLEATENQDINVWIEFLEDFLDKLDKYTVEIDERLTDFLDFWAIASCWLKEKLGLTDEDDNEEEMEVDQASIEDRSEELTRRGGNIQDRMVGMVEILGKGEKPTGEQDVGADYRDDREKDLDQEGDGDQRCRKKKEIGLGAVRMREGRPKHGLARGAGGDEDEDEKAPTTNKEMDYEGEDEEARKVIVAEETVGTVNKQESVGKGRRRMRGMHSRI